MVAGSKLRHAVVAGLVVVAAVGGAQLGLGTVLLVLAVLAVAALLRRTAVAADPALFRALSLQGGHVAMLLLGRVLMLGRAPFEDLFNPVLTAALLAWLALRSSRIAACLLIVVQLDAIVGSVQGMIQILDLPLSPADTRAMVLGVVIQILTHALGIVLTATLLRYWHRARRAVAAAG